MNRNFLHSNKIPTCRPVGKFNPGGIREMEKVQTINNFALLRQKKEQESYEKKIEQLKCELEKLEIQKKELTNSPESKPEPKKSTKTKK
jgi:hypothetical protein